MSGRLFAILFQVAVGLMALGCVSAAEAAAIAPGAPPQSSTTPSVSGTPVERETLVVQEGDWTSATPVSFTYQWSRCATAESCVDLPDATAKSYVATAADVGQHLRARVYAQNAAGTVPRTTELTGAVAWAPPLNLTPPALVGSGREAEPLSVEVGTWAGNVSSLQVFWQRCDQTGCALLGHSAPDYTPTFADVGARFYVEVVATGPGGSTTAASPERQIVAMPPANVALPEIHGEAREGVTLTAAPGSWSWNVDRFEYQWLTSAGRIAPRYVTTSSSPAAAPRSSLAAAPATW